MNKVFVLLSVCLFLAVGCKDNKNEDKESVYSLDEINQILDQTNEIIDYTNGVIKYMNESTLFINNRYVDFEQLIDLAKKRNISESFDIYSDIYVENDKISYGKKRYYRIIEPPSVFQIEEIQFFAVEVSFYIEQRNLLARTANMYVRYLKNEGYKEDNWAKATEYAEIIKKACDNCLKTRPLISEKIEVVTERATTQAIETSPIKEAIFTVKQDYELADKLNDAFYEVSRESNSLKELEKYYVELQTNVAKNKELHRVELEKEGKLDSYLSFYSTLEEIIGDYSKLIRKLKEEKEFSSADFSRLSTCDLTVVESYIDFWGSLCKLPFKHYISIY